MDSSNLFEHKKRFLLSLYPDIEEAENSEDERTTCSDKFDVEKQVRSHPRNSSATEREGTISLGSLSSRNDDVQKPSLQKPQRPFWVPNRHYYRQTSKTTNKDELCTADVSPKCVSLDPAGDEDEERRAFSFYFLLTSSILLVGMGFAIFVLSLTFVKERKSAADGGTPNSSLDPPVRVYRPTTNNIFDLNCDISELESTCRLEENKERKLDLSEIPKCVQDNFNLVYVRAGHDAYYQLHSIEPLQSCSSEGMALKRLSALEHEKSTTGLLNCEFTAYSWYYEYGEVEWWTENGVVQTGICERDNVACGVGGQPGSTTVELFVTDQGEECRPSALSL